MPVQSGSDSVLQRMRRDHTIEFYKNLIVKLRQIRPDIVLSTDIICGFPNETEEEHNATLELLRDVEFDFIYSYAYSKRPGTRAAKLEDELTDETRSRRLQEVQKLQLEIQAKNRKSMEGKVYRVLVEGQKEKHGEKKWFGRTNCMRIVHFKGTSPSVDYTWRYVDVFIESATALSCQGQLLRDYSSFSSLAHAHAAQQQHALPKIANIL